MTSKWAITSKERWIGSRNNSLIPPVETLLSLSDPIQMEEEAKSTRGNISSPLPANTLLLVPHPLKSSDVGFSKICHSPDDGPPRPNPENNLVTGEIASSSGTTPDRDWVTAQGRTIIYIDNFDFTTIHNIIYYLYTGRVNLHHSPETHKANAISIPDGYPDPVDPFQLYIASNRYLAKYLQKQCYEFLVKTCTPENICGRLFNIACLPHEDLTKEFLDYLIDNYQEVKFTEGWTKLHKKMASFTLVEIDFFSGLLLRISMLDQFTQEEESEDENDESEQDDDDDADGVDADEDPHGLMSALTTWCLRLLLLYSIHPTQMQTIMGILAWPDYWREVSSLNMALALLSHPFRLVAHLSFNLCQSRE